MIGYRRVKLGDILEQYKVEHIVQDGVSYRQVTISQTGNVSVRGTKEGSEIGRKRQFIFDLKNYPNTLTFIRQGVQKGGIGIAPKEVDGCIATENMPMFTISDSVSTTYLKNYLKSIHFRRSLSKLKASGTAQKSIHERDLLEIELDIPDLETQIRIVKNLSDKGYLIQEVKSEIEKNKYKLNQLKQAYLQEAVQGKLTAKWREDNPNIEPASELLKRIEAQKQKLIADKKIKKEKSLPPVGEDEIPYELPEGWGWCHFGELASFINGDRGKNYPNKSEYVAEGVAWINTGHIEPNGTLSKERMNFITRNKFDSLRSGKIQNGDLVYCLRGATFGKTAFVNPYSEGAVASSLMIIRSHTPEISNYIYRFLISPEGKKQLLRFDNGSAQPNLSANNVKLYLFPLPPLAEQKAIVEKVNSLMALCNQLEQQIETSQNQIEQLMQSCLKEVFEHE